MMLLRMSSRMIRLSVRWLVKVSLWVVSVGGVGKCWCMMMWLSISKLVSLLSSMWMCRLLVFVVVLGRLVRISELVMSRKVISVVVS